MAGSTYVQFRTGSLSSSLTEGEAVPLLKSDSGDECRWAFAIAKPDGDGRNLLLAALLQALGFTYDDNNGSNINDNTNNYDFYYLTSSLTGAISNSLFANFPDAAPTPDDTINVESNGSLELKEGSDGLTLSPAEIKVAGFVLHDEDSKMQLAEMGETATNPQLNLAIQLDASRTEKQALKDWGLGISSTFGTTFRVKFRAYGTGADDGFVTCNGKRVIPNNDEGPVTADPRHHRLTLDNGALRYPLDPEDPLARRSAENLPLCLELPTSIRMRPHPDLPVHVIVAGPSLVVTFDSSDRVFVASVGGPPCVTVTVSGPLIHAPSSSGESDWLPIVETVQMKFGLEVEEINNVLTYSFSVCLPSGIFEQIPWPSLPEKPESLLKLLENIEQPILEMEGTILPEMGNILPSLLIRFTFFRAEIRDYMVNQLGLPDFDFDFEFSLPEIGPPPRFPGFSIANIARIQDKFFRVELKKLYPTIPDLDFPDGYDLRHMKLRIRATVLAEFVEFNIEDPLVLKFVSLPRFGGDVGDIEVGDILELWDREGKIRLPDIRIRKIDIDLQQITLERPLDLKAFNVDNIDKIEIRIWRPGLFHVFRVKSITGLNVDLEFEQPELPKFGKVEFKPDDLAEFLPDVDFPLTRSFLKGLLGELPSIDFRLGIPDAAFQRIRWKLDDLWLPDLEQWAPPIPFELSLRIPKPGVEPPEFPILRLWVGIPVDLATFRLPSLRDVANRVYFYFPRLDSKGSTSTNGQPSVRQQAVDLDLLTLSIPLRENIKEPPSKDSHDGYLDLGKRELVIALKQGKPSPDEQEKLPPSSIQAYFPGGVSDKAIELGLEGLEQEIEQLEQQIEQLEEAIRRDDIPEEDKARYEQLAREYEQLAREDEQFARELKRRFQLELKALNNKDWPEIGTESFYLRLNANGLTLNAELLKTEVEVDTTGTETEKADPESNTTKPTGLIKPFTFAPQEKRDEELRSRLVIIDNELREAAVYATTVVPGTDNLMAQVEVALKQTEKGKLPDVVASLELERGNEAPITEFSIGLLELKLKRLEMTLVWERSERDWDYALIADGSIGFQGTTAVIPDLEGLKAPAIEVVGLDLRKMSLKQLRVPLQLERPVRFEILSGLFAVELGDLDVAWEWDVDKNLPVPRLLGCKLAKFAFQEPGALEVHVKVGGLEIEFDPSLTARIRVPSRLGLEVAIGPAARFVGEVGWVDDVVRGERYFFAAGTVSLEGLPEVTALLKFGTGLKLNGQRQINMVLFGGLDVDYPLFSGVVVKNLGAGIGLNNRLAAVPPLPSAEAVLDKIDSIRPETIDAWSFVREDGLYFSIVGKLTLASTQGDISLINAYVASLVLSIDSNFDITAAGKLWLSCSLKGVRAHFDNPALIGALVLNPRHQKLEVAVESLPDPFVEENELIKKLFSKGRVRFSFRMAPGLVDYFLEEVSYRDEMYGVQLVYTGSYRFAIFRDAVLLRSDLAASGTLSRSLRAGPGGFNFDGHVRLAIGYGGLLSLQGAMAYAYLDASATFNVSAWIEIGFKKSFKVFGKRITISWSVKFSARAPSLELTIRGNVGLNDQASGLIGVDCQVGINFSICGYRLRVSARLAHNPEIYDQVRARISAFERDLEDYISRTSSQSEPSQLSPQAGAPSPMLAAAVAATAMAATVAATDDETEDDVTSSDSGEVLRKAAQPLSRVMQDEPESWLRYQAGTRQLLIPSAREQWLTPRYSAIQSINVDTDGKTITVTSPEHGLVKSSENLLTIQLVGLRNSESDRKYRFDALNGRWDLSNVEVDKFTLKHSDGLEHFLVNDGSVDSEQVFKVGASESYRGGTWFVVGADIGEPAQAAIGEMPQMPDAVQRIVVRTKEWLEVTSVRTDRSQLVISVNMDAHEAYEPGSRVVFRRRDGRALDNGAKAASNVSQLGDVTYQVRPSESDDDGVFRIVLSEGDERPKKGWKVAAAVEVVTLWDAANRRSLVRRLAAILEPERLSDALESIEIMSENAAVLIETAVPADGQKDEPVLPDHAAYRVLSDPRYESADRHWMPLEDQFLLPDGILSTRFRALNEIDEADESELRAIRDFIAARDRLVRQELHNMLDQDGVERLYEARAQVAQLAINELANAGRSARFGSVSPLDGLELLAGKCGNQDGALPLKEVKLGEDEAKEAARLLPDALRAGVLQIAFRFTSNDDPKIHNVIGWSSDQSILHVEPKLEQMPNSSTDFAIKMRDPNLRFGYMFALDSADARDSLSEANRVFVRRAGKGTRVVRLIEPEKDSEASLAAGITCLPIRQEFLVDQQSTGEGSIERARVVVKLPLQFDEKNLKDDLEAIGRLQIFRRFPWQREPVLLRDFIVPEINFLDEPKKLYPPPGEELQGKLQTDKTQIVLANLSSELPTSKLPGLVIGMRARNRRFIARIQDAIMEDNDLKIKLDRRIPVGRPDEDVVLSLISIYSAGLMVCSPYVFSDEFLIENRRFADPVLAGHGMRPDHSKVAYSVRIARQGEALAGGKEPQAAWDPVPLHIPEPDPFPKRLAAAIPVRGLELSSKQKPIEFQLLAVDGEAPRLAAVGERPLEAKDFELWASEVPLQQSGFFAGGSSAPAMESPVDNSRLTLDSVSAEDRLESVKGKFPLLVNDVKGDAGAFCIQDPSLLRPGMGYALFIRPKSRAAFGLVARMDQFLVRERPTIWDGAVRYRVVEQLERFLPTVREGIERADVELLPPGDFSIDDLFQDGRNALRMTWRSRSLFDGGVEIVVQDHDDSGLIVRQLCEALGENLFQESRRDFSNSAYWDVSRKGQRERLAIRAVGGAPKDDLGQRLRGFFLFAGNEGASDLADHKLIRNLRDNFDNLWVDGSDRKNLKLWHALYDSTDPLGPAAQFLARLHQVRKSPLNLHDPIVEQIADLFHVLIRRLFTGLKMPPLDDWSRSDLPSLMAYAETFWEQETAFRKELEEIDQADPSDMPADDSGAEVFLDRDTARQLAGIVQRRNAIADDVLSLRDTRTGPSAPSIENKELLPRQGHWAEVVIEARSLLSDPVQFSTRLPMTAKLNEKVLRDSSNELVNLLRDLFTQLETKLTDAEAFAKVARRAAGMTEFLGELENADEVHAVIKRPHHELVTKADASGRTIAQPTPLANYLSDDARSHPPDQLPPIPAPGLEELPLRVGRLATMEKDGWLKVWTADDADLTQRPMRLLQQWFTKIDDGDGNEVRELQFAEDHRGLHILAVANQRAYVWDALTGKLLRRLQTAPYETQRARFAQTAQGLEVLTVDKRIDGDEDERCLISARNIDQSEPRARFFKKGESRLPELTCVAYDGTSRLVAAGTVDGHVVAWRDLGKGDQTQPLAMWKVTDQDPASRVTHIDFIHRPEGIRIIATVATAIALIDPKRRVSRDGADKPLHLEGAPITSLAVDKERLRIAIGIDGGKVVVLDDSLRETVRQEVDVETPQVSFLRSKGFTYLATTANNERERVQLWEVQGDSLQKKQTLRGSGQVLKVSTCFGRAQTSSTSRSLVALFNLWERMGFALDLALVDKRNQLLPRKELQKILKATMENLESSGSPITKTHSFVRVTPQEPDGDFRPHNKVGFAFAKVARVPHEFHEACRHAGPISVGKFLGYGKDTDGGGNSVVNKTLLCVDDEILAVVDEQFEAAAILLLSGKAQGQVRKIEAFDREKRTITINSEWQEIEDPSVVPGDTLAVVDLKAKSAFRIFVKWLDYRSVTLPFAKLHALGDQEATPIPDISDKEAERQFALSIVQIMHVRDQACYLGALNAEDELGEIEPGDGSDAGTQAAGEEWPRGIELEPQVERWLVVPSAAGWSHSAWTVPDRKGHRFRVAIRRVSRYEPLVRWWLKRHTPVDVPAQSVVVDGNATTSSQGALLLSEMQVDDLERLNAHAWLDHSLRLNIVEGPGAGQRRQVARYDAENRLVYIDPGDPWLQDPTSESRFQILADSPHWSPIELPPTLDPYLNEGPQPVTVYQYPRARAVVFSYQIPPEGQRALYNQISKVRTGYQGIEQMFRYLLLDRPHDDPQRIEALMCDLRQEKVDKVPAPAVRYAEVPASDSNRIRLFRHERLVSLPHLPFFYRYRLDVRSLFEMRPADKDTLVEADLLPDDPNLSPLAERRPTRLQLQQPDVRPVWGTGCHRQVRGRCDQ